MTRLRLTNMILRWAARLTATLLLGMVLIIVVGECVLGDGGPNFAKMNWLNRSMFLVEFIAILGLAVIWKWELFGGLLVIGGMAIFYWIHFAISGKFPGGAFPLFYVPGVLATISWISARFAIKSRDQ